MTEATSVARSRFVRPEEIRSLAHLLKRSGASIESEIRGSSMGRTLPNGTRVRIRCGEGLPFETGQIIAFLGDDRLIAHRMCGRGRTPGAREFLLTRGDATNLCDAPVPVATVLGIVTTRLGSEGWGDVPAPPPSTTPGRVMQALANTLLDVHPALARMLAVVVFRLRNTVARSSHHSP